MNEGTISQIWSELRGLLISYNKFHRINALANALNGAKNTKAGHRVYLRSATLLEYELSIDNTENAESNEGYSFPAQMKAEVAKAAEKRKEDKPDFTSKIKPEDLKCEEYDEPDE